MSLYVEDDNYVNPCPPVQPLKPLLRFRHNIGEKLIIDPTWNFDESVAYMIERKHYKPSTLKNVDFFGDFLVPIICKTVYIGTTATLFAPDGNFIAQIITKLHPQDQFCRLTGRVVAQSKLLNMLRCNNIKTTYDTRATLIKKLLANKTAQPLNW